VAQVKIFQQSGYWPLFVTGSNLYYQHTLCGEHAVQGAISPNSGRPLLRYFALDLRDDRLGLGAFSTRRLDLFFAWTCEISRDVFTYRIQRENRVEILHYRQGAAYSDFPYANYPAYFPARLFELRKITPEEQKTIAAVNRRRLKPSTIHDDRPDLVRPLHQFCGEPYLVNSPREVTCPVCQGEMPIYASASDETMSERGFVQSNFVQVLFHLCASCAVVTAYQMAD
jgi:hypothetical protein